MRDDTLYAYKRAVVRWYDSYCGEWHCCNDWTASGEAFADDSNSDDEDVPVGMVNDSTPDNQPTVERDNLDDDSLAQSVSKSSLVLQPSPIKNKSEELKLEQTQREVLHILMSFFRFVPPLPIPETIDESTSDNDLRAAFAILGLDRESVSTSFFSTPLGKLCLVFLRSFALRETEKLSSKVWDLSTENRQYLAYNRRLSTIRPVLSTRRRENDEEKDQEREKREGAVAMEKTGEKNKKKAKHRKGNKEEAAEKDEEEEKKKRTWFMFDFGDSATVPWHLAVPSAAAALYICHLPESMTEEDVARDLFEEGIRFHTLQQRDKLETAPTDKQVCTLVPVRMSDHTFEKEDYTAYLTQCDSLLQLRRARAALLRGGYAWQIALGSMAHSQAWRGPSRIYENPDHMFAARDSAGSEYIDDNLTRVEFEILSGVYSVSTGKGAQTVK
ncbi:hypothetical protein NP233_g8105 [Leucocoprinus birnbaumii]|uniref:Uncharacterized protein n=1 Tax=Leucocoprinus birnbaumii TaxID=56174 RepID=A0AAD5VTF7_9AGAR|nr:hypothetical protein NP233_g8105 [Leucocoprinus birnbaumii]